MKTSDKIIEAVNQVVNGFPTQYIYVSGKTIRVSDHGANPQRVDDGTISIVVNNDGHSYKASRGRVTTTWERSMQFYMRADGCFTENFESVESFLNYFDIE